MIQTAALIAWLSAAAAAPGAVSAQVPGGCNTPGSQRTSEVGCYLTATQVLGELPPGPLFWHLHVYPDRPAAETARGPRGSVVESFEGNRFTATSPTSVDVWEKVEQQNRAPQTPIPAVVSRATASMVCCSRPA